MVIIIKRFFHSNWKLFIVCIIGTFTISVVMLGRSNVSNNEEDLSSKTPIEALEYSLNYPSLSNSILEVKLIEDPNAFYYQYKPVDEYIDRITEHEDFIYGTDLDKRIKKQEPCLVFDHLPVNLDDLKSKVECYTGTFFPYDHALLYDTKSNTVHHIITINPYKP